MQRFIIPLVCFAIVCIHAELPSEMKRLMNTNIDPCEDFYKYTCGGWLNNHQLHPSLSRVDTSFMVVDAYNSQVIMDIIEEKPPVLDEFWESCMAYDKITILGHKPLQQDLDRIHNAQSNDDVLELAGEFARTGAISFIDVTIAPNLQDNKHYTLYVRDANPTLPSIDYYSQEQFPMIKEQYTSYINHLMKLAGFPLSKKRKRDEKRTLADIVIAFEQQLIFFQKQVDMIYPITISSANMYWPRVFGMYLKGMKVEEKSHIENDFTIYIERPNYLHIIDHLLGAYPLEDLKVYIAFRMIHSRVEWLGEDFYSVWFKFFGQTLRGEQQPTPRTWFCRHQMRTLLPEVVGEHFYKKAFDSHREANALEMIKLIQEAMRKRIIHSTWLDQETKDRAIEKLSEVIPLIGQSKVPKSHPPILSRDDYPSNIHTILSYSFDLEIKKLGQRVNRHEWTVSPAMSNAFYVADRNAIVFPAGVLQPPLFHGPKVHPAQNFGAIGTVMGHELTHGFDTEGRFYNSEGNLHLWWSDTTTSVYETLAKHFEDQYGAFRVNEHQVNGKLTLNENIADNGGVAIAWDAYRKYMTDFKPHVNGITKEEEDQMFFIAYGQTWCEKATDEMVHQLLTTDKHSPGQWRVNGVVMNNKEFSKTFHCKANAPMNPIKKAVLW